MGGFLVNFSLPKDLINLHRVSVTSLRLISHTVSLYIEFLLLALSDVCLVLVLSLTIIYERKKNA